MCVFLVCAQEASPAVLPSLRGRGEALPSSHPGWHWQLGGRARGSGETDPHRGEARQPGRYVLPSLEKNNPFGKAEEKKTNKRYFSGGRYRDWRNEIRSNICSFWLNSQQNKQMHAQFDSLIASSLPSQEKRDLLFFVFLCYRCRLFFILFWP